MMSRSTASRRAHLLLVGLGEARVPEVLEHLVGAEREDGVAAAAGDVADRVGEEGLPHAHAADDGDVVVRLDEAQRGELVEKRPVELGLRRLVPAFELAVGLKEGPLGAEGGGLAVAPLGFVGEGEQQEVLVGHLLLAREGEALGQRVEHLRELEAAEHGLQLRRDRLLGSRFVSFVQPLATCGRKGVVARGPQEAGERDDLRGVLRLDPGIEPNEVGEPVDVDHVGVERGLAARVEAVAELPGEAEELEEAAQLRPRQRPGRERLGVAGRRVRRTRAPCSRRRRHRAGRRRTPPGGSRLGRWRARRAACAGASSRSFRARRSGRAGCRRGREARGHACRTGRSRGSSRPRRTGRGPPCSRTRAGCRTPRLAGP